MLKIFLFLPIRQAFILERFFLLEYHIFKYPTLGGYYQNHVDNNMVFLGCNHHYCFLEHCLSYVLMKVIINFMFNEIVDETTVNDGTIFVRFY
jgi:hypothetical protein